MSKKKLFFLVGTALTAILVLLAVVLKGRAQGVVLGLLFIILFVGTFTGLVLLINYLNERYFMLPRNPTHLCLNCYNLFRNPEDQNCEYCMEVYGLDKTLQLLDDFLQEQPLEETQNRIKEYELELPNARGRNILYLEHNIKNLKRITRIQEGIEKIRR